MEEKQTVIGHGPGSHGIAGTGGQEPEESCHEDSDDSQKTWKFGQELAVKKKVDNLNTRSPQTGPSQTSRTRSRTRSRSNG
jgi:hypothetical protein